MSEIVVAVFPDETKAREAAENLASAAPSHELVVHGAALLVKAADGKVTERKWTSRMPWKAPSGALVGALIGFLGGPIGAAVGFASGGLIGFAKDASDTARAEALLRKIHTELMPGKSALVAELDTHSVPAFDAHVLEFGGAVLNEPAQST
jgi:uncharacterized membrane protein